MGYKKRGFGQGKFAGFGGKCLANESPVETAARELREETGLSVLSSELAPVGVLTFVFPSRPEWDQEVHVFFARSWHGEPLESEEMRPEWYNLAAIPYNQMWDDNQYWLPHILKDEVIKAQFWFNQDNQTVKEFILHNL